jgi:hypothetical protein
MFWIFSKELGRTNEKVKMKTSVCGYDSGQSFLYSSCPVVSTSLTLISWIFVYGVANEEDCFAGIFITTNNAVDVFHFAKIGRMAKAPETAVTLKDL